MERRQRTVTAPAEAVYRSFAGLGGKRGWLYMDWAWQLRGMTIGCAAESGCGVGAVIQMTCEWVMLWTFGGWKWWSRVDWSSYAQK